MAALVGARQEVSGDTLVEQKVAPLNVAVTEGSLPLEKKGDLALCSVHFDPAWCEERLRLSGDQNTDLHHPNNGAIVQGAALFDAIAAVTSIAVPGLAVRGMSSVEILKAIYVDDSIIVRIALLKLREGKRFRFGEVCVELFDGESEKAIAQSITITLVRLEKSS